MACKLPLRTPRAEVVTRQELYLMNQLSYTICIYIDICRIFGLCVRPGSVVCGRARGEQ